MRLFNWVRAWWITWQVWRQADPEQRAILWGDKKFDIHDFVDAPRPEDS